MSILLQIGMVLCAIGVFAGIFYFVIGPGKTIDEDYEPYEPVLSDRQDND